MQMTRRGDQRVAVVYYATNFDKGEVRVVVSAVGTLTVRRGGIISDGIKETTNHHATLTPHC